jgi:hypothetical protein
MNRNTSLGYAILIPTMLFSLSLPFLYLDGAIPSPIYPDIQPQEIQQMTGEHKEALRKCQINKVYWQQRGGAEAAYYSARRYVKGVMGRGDEFWERRYLMYKDGYWCNYFERRGWIEPSGG